MTKPLVTQPGYRAGQRPPNYGKQWPTTLLQPGEVARLIDQCVNHVPSTGRRPKALRNSALIAVLYRAGPILKEALELRLADLDVGEQTIYFAGGKLAARTVAMDATAFDLLGAWLAERERLEIPGDLVFCSYVKPNPGRPIWHPYFREFLQELGNATGLGGTRVHPQAFRLSFAAELIVEGWPLHYIQAQLGITTLAGMQSLLNSLKLPPPDPAELIAVAQSRLWDLDLDHGLAGR